MIFKSNLLERWYIILLIGSGTQWLCLFAASLVEQCRQVDTNVRYEIAEKDGFCQISFQMLTSCLRPAKILRDQYQSTVF